MLGAALLARASRILVRTKRNFGGCQISYGIQLHQATYQWRLVLWRDPKYHWIDNFHTGYNLDSLKRYIDSYWRYIFHAQFEKGFRYFIDNFFEPDGKPKYYHNRMYPIDSQCAGQAIETLSYFADEYPESLPLAYKVARWYIDNMQDKKGYFYYRLYPLGIKSKAPMLHWSQATLYKGLGLLIKKMATLEEFS